MKTHRHLARVSIELETPLHLGSGKPGELADASVAMDANGLPTLPGTSLAGVLRSAFREDPNSDIEDLFGGTDQGSRLHISFGCIHDSGDRPISGLISSKRIEEDPILKAAAHGLTLRDHVRINHLGAADDVGKFDELVVHKGHRFSFELELGAEQADDPDWNTLLELLRSGNLRIGGKTRRGLGAFRVIRLQTGHFDLGTDSGYSAYTQLPISLAKDTHSLEDSTPCETREQSIYRTLRIRPESFWMFGGGEDLGEDPADMAPVRDDVIRWDNQGKGTLQTNVPYLPASSIKGAIAHRTAFHYNRITDNFAEIVTEPDERVTENNPAVKALFGFAKSGQEEGATGAKGKVIIDDLFLADDDGNHPDQQKLQHVAIDRFTGGAYPGALFNERPFFRLGKEQPEITLAIRLSTSPENLDEEALQALDLALLDVAESRLALGAGSGRGLGRFSGTIPELS